MKKSLAWHHTRLGGIVLWLGSIQFAVPVIVLVAIALGIGTYLESAHNVKMAKQYVYGSWWFLGSMVLVCVSLTFAVATRFPWKRRHIGFITVHAGLIGLIVAGFWSMFERVEGHLALQEGTMSDTIETPEEQLEILSHNAGGFDSLAAVPSPDGAATVTLAGVRIHVLERWENSRDEETVIDDSPVPLRAINIAPVGGPQTAWVGQEDQAGPAPMLMGIKVLVLPEGSDWQPPTGVVEVPKGQFAFVIDANRFPLKEVGEEVFPGWKVVELKRFARALVVGESITEGPEGSPENIAVQVKISDGKGTTEQHTAFDKFPDMVMGKPLEGSGNSASRLVPGSTRGEPETLVVFGSVAATKIGYIGLDGKGKVFEPAQKYPMTINLGAREVTIHQQLARAHAVTRTVKMPVAKENRVALLVRIGDSTELQTLAWKAMTHVNNGDNNTMVLHFGPTRVQLPFTVRLDNFRKTDYPGTDMAMSYQSDVGIVRSGQPDTPYEIYMNHPYAMGPWKVYQSGFMGENMSIFSVMRDPGVPLTYLSSIVLCLGVVITFYSRSMSWGHPGIPIRPGEVNKESSDASSRAVRPVVVNAPDVPEPVGSAG
ncbi:MAG: cytochrome c biogenesis protein ResB [Planctomycetota bacterium]